MEDGIVPTIVHASLDTAILIHVPDRYATLNPKSGYENYGKNSQSVSSVSQPLVAVPRGVLGRFFVRGDAPYRFSNQVRHSAIAVT